MTYGKIAWRLDWQKGGSLLLTTLGALALLCLCGARPAHAQGVVEYSGATGVSAGATASQPHLSLPGAPGRPNKSLSLAKPSGPPPGKVNRDWFAKHAGQHGGQLSIDAIPPQSSVWIDGKFVGHAPITVTLPAGKHRLSLQGPREEHAKREVEIAAGKKQRLEIRLQQTYPQAVSITVFGNKKKH